MLDVFGYNFDEDMLLGQKAKESWPLLDSISSSAVSFGSYMFDLLNFGKSDHETLASAMEDFVLEEEEEMLDDEEEKDGDNSNDIVEEARPRESSAMTNEDHGGNKQGRDLASIYAETIKDMGVMLTFGLAFPLIALVGAIGICIRAITLSYLVELWGARAKRGEVEMKTTDAQGIPFRCVGLVVFTTLGFFGTAAIVSGLNVESGGGGGLGLYTLLTLGVCSIILVLQLWMLNAKRFEKRLLSEGGVNLFGKRRGGSKNRQRSSDGNSLHSENRSECLGGGELSQPLLDKTQ